MLIHVGLPRTGSTTLQDDVFNRASNVYYLGRIRGPKNLDPTSRSSHAIDTIVNMDDETFEEVLPSVQAQLAMQMNNARLSGKNPVLSHEGLAWKPRRSPASLAYRCRQVFGPARVLIISREQRRWLISCYLKYLKASLGKGRLVEAASLSFPDYVAMARDGKIWGTAAFHIGDIFEAFAREFGPDNVFVVPNEWLKTDLGRFLEILGELTGCNSEELGGLLTRTSNLSLNVGQIRYLRSCRTLGIKPDPNSLLHRVFKRSWRATGASAINIPPDIEQWIADIVARQNKLIEMKKGIDLRSLGYLVEDHSTEAAA